MTKRRVFIGATLLVLSVIFPAQAQEDGTQPPPRHRMELVYVFDREKTEYVFVIGNVGFKSVAALKEFVSRLPPGSALEWAPGCERFGDEPLLSSEEEMNAFKAFCEEMGVKFILIPSG